MSGTSPPAAPSREVTIPCGNRTLRASFAIPNPALAAIVFAHGSGSGRFSSRNQFVASDLQQAGMATLLIDLLEPAEAEDRRRVFDIELLADSLNCAMHWLNEHDETALLAKGYFGASTGAAAALFDDALRPGRVGAIVSRGGRPDLAGESLTRVQAPTLLVVGSADPEVLNLNRLALEKMRCPKELRIVPGATHLFPEPGTLEFVAQLARTWFLRHLTSSAVDAGDRAEPA